MNEEVKDLDAVIKQIVAKAGKKSAITFKEMVEILEKTQLEPDQIEKVYEALENANIDIIEDSTDIDDDEPNFVIAISNNGWFIPSYEPYLQRLIIRYYATLSGASVYHAINGSPSEIITPRKMWINKFLALFKTA